MTADVFFFDEAAPLAWSDVDEFKRIYGAKAGTLATLPRHWTLPFALIPAAPRVGKPQEAVALLDRGEPFLARLRALAGEDAELIVRSSSPLKKSEV